MALLPLTWNADRERLPSGLARTHFGVKHRNFLRADSAWQAIDAHPLQVGNVLQIANAPYKLEAPLLASGDFRFDATIRWDIHRKGVIGSNAAGVTKRFPGAADSPAVVDGYMIRYPLAMPSIGADIVIRPHEQKVNFLYEWQAVPPGFGAFVECPIEFAGDVQPEFAKAQGRSIDTRDALVSSPLTYQANSNRGVTIKPAKAWDSLGRQVAVQLRLKRDGNRLVGVKLVPRAFLVAAFANGATWVRSDTTSTFYPNADAESTSVDGHVYREGPDEAWSSIRDGAGTYALDNGVTEYIARVRCSSTSDQYEQILRSIFLFDTSALPDTDNITAATFSIYGTGIDTSGSASWDQYYYLGGSTPASNTALDASDYSQLGTTNYSDGDYNDTFNTSDYNALTLNAAGRTAISKTGVSKFGVRQIDDFNSTPVPFGWNSGATRSITGTFAEQTGTTQDPKLVVTHEAAPSGPPLPSSLHQSSGGLLNLSGGCQ